jgi:hypothetical protein
MMFQQRRSPGRGLQTPEGSVLMRWDGDLAVNGVIAMQEINMKLFRNDEFKDWSIEINGRFHEHVPDKDLTELVEGALIVAAKSLIQASVNAGALQRR